VPRPQDIARCDREIALALFAVTTGRDPVEGHPVALADALLYLTDWESERARLLPQPENPMLDTTLGTPITPHEAIAVMRSLWQKEPCSVCAAVGSGCVHRAPSLASFIALMTEVAPPTPTAERTPR